MVKAGLTERHSEAHGASPAHPPFGDMALIQSCKLLTELVVQFHGPDNAYAAAEASGCSEIDLDIAGRAHLSLYERLNDLQKQISATTAVSLEGILAKMRTVEVIKEAEGSASPEASDALHRSYVADVRALSQMQPAASVARTGLDWLGRRGCLPIPNG